MVPEALPQLLSGEGDRIKNTMTDADLKRIQVVLKEIGDNGHKFWSNNNIDGVICYIEMCPSARIEFESHLGNDEKLLIKNDAIICLQLVDHFVKEWNKLSQSSNQSTESDLRKLRGRLADILLKNRYYKFRSYWKKK